MTFDIGRLIVPFIVVGMIVLSEAMIVFLIWLDNKLKRRNRGGKR